MTREGMIKFLRPRCRFDPATLTDDHLAALVDHEAQHMMAQIYHILWQNKTAKEIAKQLEDSFNE